MRELDSLSEKVDFPLKVYGDSIQSRYFGKSVQPVRTRQGLTETKRQSVKRVVVQHGSAQFNFPCDCAACTDSKKLARAIAKHKPQYLHHKRSILNETSETR